MYNLRIEFGNATEVNRNYLISGKMYYMVVTFEVNIYVITV